MAFDGISAILQDVSTLHTYTQQAHTVSDLGYHRESPDVGSELSGNPLRYPFELR